MDRSRHVGLARSASLVLMALCVACAVSSYDDDFDELDAELSPVTSFDAGARADSGAGADSGGREDATTSPPVYVPPDASGPGPSTPRDASTPAPVVRRDAGTSVTTRDAGGVPRDASVSQPPSSDASASGGACKQDSDCDQLCVPIGILACCTEEHQCGCTWAPGAYCF